MSYKNFKTTLKLIANVRAAVEAFMDLECPEAVSKKSLSEKAEAYFNNAYTNLDEKAASDISSAFVAFGSLTNSIEEKINAIIADENGVSSEGLRKEVQFEIKQLYAALDFICKRTKYSDTTISLANGDVVKLYGMADITPLFLRIGKWKKENYAVTLRRLLVAFVKKVSINDVLKELNEIPFNQFQLNDVNIEKVIGKGSFGMVSRAIVNGQSVAVKQLKFKNISNVEEYIEKYNEFLREADNMHQFNHENIVSLNGVVMQDKNLYLVMELAQTDLLKFLNSDADINWSIRLDLATQIADGVSYMHDHNAIHRDLKSENILVSAEGWKITAKISDMASVRTVDEMNQPGARYFGTLLYSAPELLNSKSLNSKSSDVFSLAVMCNVIGIRHETALDIMTLSELKSYRNNESIDPLPKDTPQAFKDIIRYGINKDPSMRPSAKWMLGAIRHLRNNVIRAEDSAKNVENLEDAQKTSTSHIVERSRNELTSAYASDFFAVKSSCSLNGNVKNTHGKALAKELTKELTVELSC